MVALLQNVFFWQRPCSCCRLTRLRWISKSTRRRACSPKFLGWAGWSEGGIDKLATARGRVTRSLGISFSFYFSCTPRRLSPLKRQDVNQDDFCTIRWRWSSTDGRLCLFYYHTSKIFLKFSGQFHEGCDGELLFYQVKFPCLNDKGLELKWHSAITFEWFSVGAW